MHRCCYCSTDNKSSWFTAAIPARSFERPHHLLRKPLHGFFPRRLPPPLLLVVARASRKITEVARSRILRQPSQARVYVRKMQTSERTFSWFRFVRAAAPTGERARARLTTSASDRLIVGVHRADRLGRRPRYFSTLDRSSAGS